MTRDQKNFDEETLQLHGKLARSCRSVRSVYQAKFSRNVFGRFSSGEGRGLVEIDEEINNGAGKEGFNPVTGFSSGTAARKESRAQLTRR